MKKQIILNQFEKKLAIANFSDQTIKKPPLGADQFPGFYRCKKGERSIQ